MRIARDGTQSHAYRPLDGATLVEFAALSKAGDPPDDAAPRRSGCHSVQGKLERHRRFIAAGAEGTLRAFSSHKRRKTRAPIVSPPVAPVGRPALSARRDLGRARRQLRPVLGQRHQGRALPVRRGRQARDRAHRAAGIHRRGLARLSARCAAGHGLRLPRARPLRAGGRPSLQSQQAAARSLRQADDRPHRVEPGAVRLPGRERRRPRPSTSATARLTP